MATATLAAVEAEETMLQVYALQWRAIDLRAKQLQNQCRQVELDEELDREEHDLLREHELLLRMKEKQLAQQQYEDRFKLSAATAAVRKLQVQTEQLQQRRESLVATQRPSSATATLAVAAKTTTTTTLTTTTAAVIKRKRKAKSNEVPAAATAITASNATATSKAANGDASTLQSKPKEKTTKKKQTKSVAFSPRKPAATASGHMTVHSTRPRRLEESFNDEDDDEHDARSAPAVAPAVVPTKPSAADELLRMLSADKASDSEGDGNTTLADLLFSPAGSRPSSPRRGAGMDSTGTTPSKATPSKLARSVAKKAMSTPLEFDFTRKAALAKARAAREQQQAAGTGAGSDDDDNGDAPADPETPSKKALKRRKDLGISFVDKPAPAATSKSLPKPTTAPTTIAAAVTSSGSGGRSLMEMIGAASLVGAKLSKTKEQSSDAAPSDRATTTEASKVPAVAAAQPAKTKATKKKRDAVKDTRRGDAAEPESENFASLQTANVTKRAKPKTAATKSTSVEGEADASSSATGADKPKAKNKDKPSAMEQAIAKADVLTRMTHMQDIATPQVAGKKTRKVLLKKTGSATSFAAATRAKFQTILADGAAPAQPRDLQSDNDNGDDTAGGGGFETPRKAPSMKRKRAQDAPVPAPKTSYLQSPSVTALLAMRPSKSPIGIRYVPKPLKTPQSIRKRPRAGDDESSGVDASSAPSTSTGTAAAGLTTRAQKRGVRDTGAAAGAGGGIWSNSSASFFDAFVNGGAPRLKRSVVP